MRICFDNAKRSSSTTRYIRVWLHNYSTRHLFWGPAYKYIGTDLDTYIHTKYVSSRKCEGHRYNLNKSKVCGMSPQARKEVPLTAAETLVL